MGGCEQVTARIGSDVRLWGGFSGALAALFRNPCRVAVLVLATVLALPAERGAAQQTDSQPEPPPSRPGLLVNHGCPRLSPDGRNLLIVDDFDGDHEVHMVNQRTGHRTQLTNNDAFDYTPGWAPSSQEFVFVSDRTGNSEIWVMGLTSRETARQITHTLADEAHPTFSGDGKLIAFSRSDVAADSTEAAGSSIWMRDLASGQERRRTHRAGMEDSYPELTRDGQRLVFTRTALGSTNSEIVVREMATGIEQVVAPSPGRDDYPTWSPDGAWIAFASDRHAERAPGFDLYRVHPDGTALERLTMVAGEIRFYHRPSFAPDGRTLLANRGSPGRLEVVRVQRDTSGEAPTVEVLPRP